MSVKTTGAEFKAYYHDDKYWVKDSWHDDHVIKINGEYVDDIVDDEIPDDAEVVIESGVVYIPTLKESGFTEDKDVSLTTHFKNWRKQNKYVFLTVEVEKDKLSGVLDAIRAVPGVTKVKGG